MKIKLQNYPGKNENEYCSELNIKAREILI